MLPILLNVAIELWEYINGQLEFVEPHLPDDAVTGKSRIVKFDITPNCWMPGCHQGQEKRARPRASIDI